MNNPVGAQDHPFSRIFRVEEASEAPVEIEISTSDEERSAIAAQVGIPELSELTAHFRIVPAGRGRFDVTGRIGSRLTQICVVSLEPFETELDEDISVTFAPEVEAETAAARFAARPENDYEGAEEPPDAIVDGKIDLGNLALEFLILGLDPYPRRPGVEFEPEPVSPKVDAKESPFAALAKLKTPPGS